MTQAALERDKENSELIRIDVDDPNEGRPIRKIDLENAGDNRASVTMYQVSTVQR
jgi:hypothetical protein